MTDIELATQITEAMKTKTFISRNQICRAFHTSQTRLSRMQKAGLLQLPAAMTQSAAGPLSRTRNKTYQGWYIHRPAPWHQGGKL